MKTLLIGGSGFVGGHLAARLIAAGHSITVPTRRRERAMHLAMLPGCDVLAANVYDDADLARLVQGQDAVINLVGILHGNAAIGDAKYGTDWQRAHVALPQRVVAACEAAQVPRYLHMSALGANPQGPSMYQRSKGDGEAVVTASKLAWTIFRPSVIYGADDKFLNLFASLLAIAPLMPLAGAQCRFQPVHVDDVAAAMVAALGSLASIGKTYELAGPDTLTLKELVQLAGRASGNSRWVLGIPDVLGRAQALALKLAYIVIPGEPPLSADNLDSMKVDNVLSGNFPGLAELGISAQHLATSAPPYLAARQPSSRMDVLRKHAGR